MNKLFRRSVFRNVVFLTLALVTFYDQIFVAESAQPILIFLGLFFLGAVPALQGDKQEGTNVFARFFMGLMGVGSTEERDKNQDGTDSLDDTLTSSDWHVSSHHPPSSRKG
jgi:hypothetical protein